MADAVLSLLTDFAIPVPVTLFVVTVALLYLYSTWTFDTWSKLGIPGPKPIPLFGNGKYLNEKGYEATVEWTKQYGKNVGIYMGRMPALLTSDFELIKDVMIKNFQHFYNRKISCNDLMPRVFTMNLVSAKGEHWKRQRQSMTGFSAKNLKMMQHFISHCCQNLLQGIDKATKNGQLIDVKGMFGAFTLDVIAGTGFGIQTNSILDKESEFLSNIKMVLKSWEVGTVPVAIATEFPVLAPLMKMVGIYSMKLKETTFVEQAVTAIMEEKKQNSEKSQDLLQQMMDVEASEEEVLKNPDKKQMTADEIVAEGLAFFVAGYETTATTLQFLTYLLALNADKQEKLYHAIVDTIGDAEPTYENVASIPYLDNCVHEALRLYPPAVMVERHANAPSTVNGIKLPAGVSVLINLVSLMRDENFFPHPDAFIPERFDDSSHPIPSVLKEMAFGAGPRQCIGMRMALFQTKMAVVTVIRNFRFVKVKETMEKFEPAVSIIFNIPREPIMLATERR